MACKLTIVVDMLTVGVLFIGAGQVNAQPEFGTPGKMGPNINNDRVWEAGPSISHDGLELFFSGGGGRQLYLATRDTKNSEFRQRESIGSGAHPSISDDGLSVYFHAGGNSDDLWVMERDSIDADWEPAEILGDTVNSAFDEKAPSISANNKELYFNRSGAGGGATIWVTKRDDLQSEWTEPERLDPHINRTQWTFGPDITSDGLTLLFSSLGRSGGFGDADLWMATRDTLDSPWGEPVNLGPEVNTFQSEISPNLSADGSTLYFSRGDNATDVSSFDLWKVPVILPPAQDGLQPGDADQDFDFDQLDLVQVQIAAKYLSEQPATWGEGDWDGAPGGEPGMPPAGDGVFDQLDVIIALGTELYLTGPYASVQQNGQANDGQTSIVYNVGTGELAVDTPAGTELTSINIDSAAGIFTGDSAQNLGGSFDNDADSNIFKATFGSSFGSLSFGNVAERGLAEEFLLNDLSVVGSLQGGGDLGEVDLIYVPEPSSLLLTACGLIGLVAFRRLQLSRGLNPSRKR